MRPSIIVMASLLTAGYFYGSRTRVDVSVGPVNEYEVPGLSGVIPDGIAVEYATEKPQLGKVEPVTASGW
jgi:hypothetical protein